MAVFTAAPSALVSGSTIIARGGTLRALAANAFRSTDATPVDLTVQLGQSSSSGTIQLIANSSTNFGGALTTGGTSTSNFVNVGRATSAGTGGQHSISSATTTSGNLLRFSTTALTTDNAAYSIKVGDVANAGTFEAADNFTNVDFRGVYITGTYSGTGTIGSGTESAALAGTVTANESGVHFANGLTNNVAALNSGIGIRRNGALFAEGASTVVNLNGAITNTSANAAQYFIARTGGKIVVSATATNGVTGGTNKTFYLLGDGAAGSAVEFAANPGAFLSTTGSAAGLGDVELITNSATVSTAGSGLTIAGSGLAKWTFNTADAVVTLAGSVSVAESLTVNTVANATFNTNGFSVTAGKTLAKSGNGILTVNAPIALSTGTLQNAGGGTFTVASLTHTSGATISNTGAGSVSLTGTGVTLTGTLNFAGTGGVSASNLAIPGTGEIKNTSTAGTNSLTGTTVLDGIITNAGAGQINVGDVTAGTAAFVNRTAVGQINLNGVVRPKSGVAAGLDLVGAPNFAGSIDTGTAASTSLTITADLGSSAALNIGSGRYVAGKNTLAVNSLTIAGGGEVRPGASAGTLPITGNVTLDDGGAYAWELSDAAGSAGTGWDLLAINGNLDIQSTSSNPFIISAIGTAGGGTTDADYLWTIATVTSGSIQNFSADKFIVNASGINTFGRYFEVRLSGSNLQLAMVPELSVLLGALPCLGLGMLRRRRGA
jgi:hypothetical protein